MVEKKLFPREKTCGDGLTPRSVRQLDDMGLKGSLNIGHRFVGLRSCAFGKILEMRWPEHPSFPSEGYVITRIDLDQLVAERAAKAGADLRQGCEALEPILGDRRRRRVGASGLADRRRSRRGGQGLPGRRARYEPATSSSPTAPTHASGGLSEPPGTATSRSEWLSAGTTDPTAATTSSSSPTSTSGIPPGRVVPGYGWIFPLGQRARECRSRAPERQRALEGREHDPPDGAFVESAPAPGACRRASPCGPADRRKAPDGIRT